MEYYSGTLYFVRVKKDGLVWYGTTICLSWGDESLVRFVT